MRAASTVVASILSVFLAPWTREARACPPEEGAASIWFQQGLAGAELVVVDPGETDGPRTCDGLPYPFVLTVVVLAHPDSMVGAANPIEVASTVGFDVGTRLLVGEITGQCGVGYLHAIEGVWGEGACAALDADPLITGLAGAFPGGQLVVLDTEDLVEPVWACGVENPYGHTAAVVGPRSAPARVAFDSAVPFAAGTRLVLGDEVYACNGAYAQDVIEVQAPGAR